MDMEECRRILTSPLNFFGQIGLTLEDAPHVFLVDKDEMQRIRGEERCLSTCFGNFPDEDTDPTLGLFTTTKLVNCVTTCSRVGNEFEVSKMAMRVPGTTKCCFQCGGKAILIHYGWASHLSDKVEEGLCHLISHMWLEQYVAENEFTQQLKEYLKEANEANQEDDRREGFREAKQAVDKYGLMTTLEHLRKWNNFHPSTRWGIVSRLLGT
ncbi:hypothetical protein Vadar_027169 [Vaccinium darrowii]|uniref:Uncharacterized protein n=1 Tax=Vaccinium darrowii TaxID=229202 RepID=A0ACB7YYK4_9ERIC|nr:hypothetical protein Vadar_027169 [Vaccinium darrowii]